MCNSNISNSIINVIILILLLCNDINVYINV